MGKFITSVIRLANATGSEQDLKLSPDGKGIICVTAFCRTAAQEGSAASSADLNCIPSFKQTLSSSPREVRLKNLHPLRHACSGVCNQLHTEHNCQIPKNEPLLMRETYEECSYAVNLEAASLYLEVYSFSPFRTPGTALQHRVQHHVCDRHPSPAHVCRLTQQEHQVEE